MLESRCCPNCGGIEFIYVVQYKFCKSCDVSIKMTDEESEKYGLESDYNITDWTL